MVSLHSSNTLRQKSQQAMITKEGKVNQCHRVIFKDYQRKPKPKYHQWRPASAKAKGDQQGVARQINARVTVIHCLLSYTYTLPKYHVPSQASTQAKYHIPFYQAERIDHLYIDTPNYICVYGMLIELNLSREQRVILRLGRCWEKWETWVFRVMYSAESIQLCD